MQEGHASICAVCPQHTGSYKLQESHTDYKTYQTLQTTPTTHKQTLFVIVRINDMLPLSYKLLLSVNVGTFQISLISCPIHVDSIYGTTLKLTSSLLRIVVLFTSCLFLRDNLLSSKFIIIYVSMQEGHASVCAVCPQHTGCTHLLGVS
jgi:hypothetical protein